VSTSNLKIGVTQLLMTSNDIAKAVGKTVGIVRYDSSKGRIQHVLEYDRTFYYVPAEAKRWAARKGLPFVLPDVLDLQRVLDVERVKVDRSNGAGCSGFCKGKTTTPDCLDVGGDCIFSDDYPAERLLTSF